VIANNAVMRLRRIWGPKPLVGLLGLAILALSLAFTSPAQASRIVYAYGARLNFVTPAGTPLGSTRRAGLFTTDIAASDDGRRVAVLQRTGTDGAHGDYYRVYVWADGERRLQQIAVGGPIQAAGAPSLALSPDGRLLAVSIGPEIRLVDLLSKRRRTLRELNGGFDIQPAFTADGRHLVFCHGQAYPQRADVYEMALRGGGARRLTRSRAPEFFPQLSPGGRHLAFLRRDGDGFDLMTARADGSAERVLRRVGYLTSRPDFSPDGRRLAFAWVKHLGYAPYPPWTLFTVRLDGGDARAVRRGIRGGPLLPQWTRSP
jgi:Tol biopolymer transport system component